MSNTNCIICGSDGKCEQCKTCFFKGCKKCADSHKDFCMTFMKDKCYVCKDHDEHVNGYCFSCFHLTCKECVVDNHLNHNILPICQAVHNIRGDIQSSIEELEVKIGDEQSVVDNVPMKQNDYKILTKRIDEEERKLHELLIATKADLLRNVETLKLTLEVQCTASKAIISSMTQARGLQIENVLCDFHEGLDVKEDKNVIAKSTAENDTKDISMFLKQLSKKNCSNCNWTRRDPICKKESSSLNLKECTNTKDKLDVASFSSFVDEDVLEWDFVNIIHSPAEVEERVESSILEVQYNIPTEESILGYNILYSIIFYTTTVESSILEVQYNILCCSRVKYSRGFSICSRVKYSRGFSIIFYAAVESKYSRGFSIIFYAAVNKPALEEECISLRHQVKSLKEKIAEMDKCLSQDERDYIVTTSRRLQELIVETKQNVTSKDRIQEITFPQTSTDFKDMFSKLFDSVIKSVEQLKHDLTERTRELNEKCVSVAIWTDKQREDVNAMHMKHEKDLHEKDGKLAFYMKEYRLNEIKIKELHSTINNLRNQCGKLQQQSFEQQKKLERERPYQNLVQENAELKTRLKQTDNWIKQQQNNTENLMSTIKQLRLQISKFEEDLQSVKSEKDDLQTRLSSIAGEKLTKGNRSITDLGDPNRPMKIGEKYGELYDNEWTDAMDSVDSIQNCFPGLKKTEQEEIVIHHLYRLLMCCYRECRNISMEQIQNIGRKVAEAICLNIKSEEELSTLPGCKEVQIYRRQNSEGFAKYLVESQIICKDVFENWDYDHKSEVVLKELITTPFFRKCVHLCWCMVIQDPLMYISEYLPLDTKYDKNAYKEFVQSGDKVKFMVWPALYLHKDGPLLHKGVVQAYW
ncbi:KTN1 [Mytilus coruscus]|uniref:KTN1 n=1 Tax=Mytilus coruscus TaxID=42192 RepID=A0A6J8C7K8_MYTCO|nr:KTN1 [Mytilus coruscus]